ncbi:MAG: hypothetical protein KDA65_06055 [Planctomycetaceae bacterium]|nr:hypothetical protein [Planctomycetaceae bacterium]
MDFQFIKTTACLTGLGLSASVVGCQSVDKQDYYQPHSHHVGRVQQVPQAYPTQSTPSHSAPVYSQPTPVYPQPVPSAPPAAPRQNHPTLIAPPGSPAPMAPPAVPGVSPYGAPNGGVKPVPAPTSWIPSPQGGYMPASYQAPHLSAPWVPQPGPNYMGPIGLITPETPRAPAAQLPFAVTPQGEPIQFLPVRFDAPTVAQNSGQAMFSPGWQNRQTTWGGQNLSSTMPWQASQNSGNPVMLQTILLPQQAEIDQTQIFPGQNDQDRFRIMPPSSELVEDWPLKIDASEVVPEARFEPDPGAIEAFVLEDLPQIQPEIRHRLKNPSSPIGTSVETITPVSKEEHTGTEDSGPLLLRFE